MMMMATKMVFDVECDTIHDDFINRGDGDDDDYDDDDDNDDMMTTTTTTMMMTMTIMLVALSPGELSASWSKVSELHFKEAIFARQKKGKKKELKFKISKLFCDWRKETV